MKRILLLKAYQPVRDHSDCPPLGLLYLISALRKRFGDTVDITFIDMKVKRLREDWLAETLAELQPDVVGISALNCEADSAHRLAAVVKAHRPEILTVLGGPYAHKRAEEILESSEFDWTFNGEADHAFPEALDRHFHEKPLDSDIPGLSYKTGVGLHVTQSQDAIKDLDALGFPAWDLIDFDVYASKPNMMTMLKGKRYAPLFTSRGCPYLCNYCHDVFGKRFIHQSAEHVLSEIEFLYEERGVDEFEIVDDIFNLHKPRLRKIMSEVKRRWPGKIHFCFPNGVRADIMDEEIVESLYQGGTYGMSIAIETVTPRLQKLVDKNLDIEKARKVIDYCDERGIVSRGFFMVGFPTETVEEIHNTIDFAIKSPLTVVFFFTVMPQPATPLYDIAMKENPEALATAVQDERMGQSFRSDRGWYQRAYGYDLGSYIQTSYARFYLAPRRLFKVLTRVPFKSLAYGLFKVIQYVLRLEDDASTPRPEAIEA